MKSAHRSAVYRVLSAAAAALLLIALLSTNALAADTDGLTVETLTFRDILALYAADRDSFGENASETDGEGVTNAAKRLAEMFTFTVGLNYTGEGLNTLTAAGGEQSTFSMTADIYDEDGDPVTISAEGGNLVEPKDGYLSGSIYMNENVDFYGLPFSFGFDTAVSSWDYDVAETAALAETVFETATGEELTALQSRASANLQQKLFELLSLVPSELLLEMFSE